jgi:hypothetical protein
MGGGWVSFEYVLDKRSKLTGHLKLLAFFGIFFFAYLPRVFFWGIPPPKEPTSNSPAESPPRWPSSVSAPLE